MENITKSKPMLLFISVLRMLIGGISFTKDSRNWQLQVGRLQGVEMAFCRIFPLDYSHTNCFSDQRFYEYLGIDFY